MANFISAFSSRKICIPLIQRDYVQPYSAPVIEGLVDQFVEALTAGSKAVNLNYIYGEDSDRGFIPVDGQQRLTTLWLFHLYIAKRIGQPFDVELVYESREYTDQFCKGLSGNTDWAERHTNADAIADRSWFITEWRKDPSVDAMLTALDVIGSKLGEVSEHTLKAMWEVLAGEDSPISFAFYPTEDLGSDIYIKMNGRGCALTGFENFKSWIDELLTVRCREGELTEDFYENWKYKIDNDWTGLFWKNRAPGVYEIDEMQLRAFYNLVYIFRHTDNAGAIQDIDEAILNKAIQDKDYSYAPYELDRNGLFSIAFFRWIEPVFDALIQINDELRNISLYFWGDNDTPLLNQMMMAPDSQEEKKRLLTYALCCYAVNKAEISFNASLSDWMYRWRNMILNDTLNGSFEEKLDTIRYVTRLCCSDSIHDVFGGIIDNSIVRSQKEGRRFEEKYLKFEKYKSDIIKSAHSGMTDALYRLGNNPLFCGSGIILSRIISSGEAKTEPERFIRYCDLLCVLFCNEGPVEGDLLRRALIYFGDTEKGFGGWEQNLWSFLSGKSDWQWFINHTDDGGTVCSDTKTEAEMNRLSLKSLLNHLIRYGSSEISVALDVITDPEKSRLAGLPVLSESTDWRYPFVYNPTVLEYMEKKCCVLNPPAGIILSRSTKLGKNCLRFNLRTLLLYNLITERGDIAGWSISKFQKDNSYVVLKKEDSPYGKLAVNTEFIMTDSTYTVRICPDDSGMECRLPIDELCCARNYVREDDSEALRRNGLTKQEVIEELVMLSRIFSSPMSASQ